MADDNEQEREARLDQPPEAVPDALNAVFPAQEAPLTKPSLSERLETLRLSMDSGFDRLTEVFDEKIAFDKFKEDQITRLHSELQQHKSNLLVQAIRPFVQGIIRLHDDTTKIVLSLKKLDPTALTPQRIFRVLEGLQEDLELILSQNGVEAFRVDGQQLDSRRQKAIKTVPSNDPEAVGQVAERIYPGFEQDGFMLQKERVAIFQRPTPVVAEAASPSGTDSENKGE